VAAGELASASMVTAMARTAPVIMYLAQEASASRSMPLEMEPITSAPSSAAQTRPRPPNRLTPAMTGPAIESSSTSLPPEDWLTAISREPAITPPAAAIVEASAKTSTRTRSTWMPARRAASMLPPVA
jgi:hypothetical protein